MNFNIGDYVVFKDEVMELYDLDLSLFKVVGFENGKVILKDVQDAYMAEIMGEDEDDYYYEDGDFDSDIDYYEDDDVYQDYPEEIYEPDFPEEEFETLEVEPEEIYPVELSKLDLLKNYIINYYLIMENSLKEGEEECSMLVYMLAESSNNLDTLIKTLENKTGFLDDTINYSDDEDFEDCRKDLIECIEFLASIESYDVPKEFVLNKNFRYREFYPHKL